METNFQKIIKLVENSDLDIKERESFLGILSQTTNEELEPLVALFRDDKNWIKILYQNYQDKKEALSVNNSELWQKIIKDEESLFNKIKKEVK